jgi:ligand-binding sensor domain-containing protein
MVNYHKGSGLMFSILFSIVLFSGCENDKTNPVDKFPATRVQSLYIDGNGTVWAGTDYGIISCYSGKWKTYKDVKNIPDGVVNDLAFTVSGGGQLWIATLNGAGALKYEMNTILSATSYTRESSGLQDNRITSVVTDAVNALWFATPVGLSMLRGSTWYTETALGDLTMNPAISLGSRSDGWIFAGTTGLGVGRFKYEESIDGITGASYYNTDWSGLPSDTVLSVYVDRNDNQWFGTPSGVAFHTSWETKVGWTVYSVADGLVNRRVQAIMEDSNGTLWFGTAGGVSSFNGEIWRSYNVQDGLADPSVNDIAEAPDGTLWFATNNGISVFDGTLWTTFSSD